MPMKRGSDGRPVNVPSRPAKPAAPGAAQANRPPAPKLKLGVEPTRPPIKPERQADAGDAGKRGGLGLWPRDDAPTAPGGRQRSPSGDQQQRVPHGRDGGGGPHQDNIPTGSNRNRAREPEGDGQDDAHRGRAARQRDSAAKRAPTIRPPGYLSPEGGGEGAPAERLDDLPTGWLVIVDGPGKGMALELGFGHNTIGRGSAMQVRLDFGDGAISREHTAIRYSHKHNTFHIFPGNNNVYLGENDEVLVPTQLTPGCLIELGQTTLRFVPFCDDFFRWD